MEKTKQIGVRFPKDLLKFMEEDGFANSPQKAIYFLSDFYFKNRANIIAYQKMMANTVIQVKDIGLDGTIKSTYDLKTLKKIPEKPPDTPKTEEKPKEVQSSGQEKEAVNKPEMKCPIIGEVEPTYKLFESYKPKTPEDLKIMCPPELKGFDRSQWISKKRQEFNI